MLWRATLAFALGVAWGGTGGVAFAAAVRLACVSGAVYLAGASRRRLAGFALHCAFLASGALAASGPLEAAGVSRTSAPRSFVVEATVCGLGGTLVRPAVELCRGVDVRAPQREVPARFLLRTSGEPAAASAFDGLVAGHRIRAQIRLLPLRPASNPGGRDRLAALQRRGIAASATLTRPELLVRLPTRDGFVWPGQASFARVFRSLRRNLATTLSGHGEGGALLRALVLGDRAGLSTERRAQFASLGIAHLLAVSGLHVALVASAGFFATQAAVRRMVCITRNLDARRVALAVALMVALVYAGLAGWGVPVRRAFGFFAVLAVAISLRRPARPGQALPLTALGLLVLEPPALFEASAQLSFAATAALWLGAPRRTRVALPRGIDGTAGLLFTSATAIAATMPILAAHGLHTGGAGLVSNLLAVPWTSFVLLPAALASALIAPFEGTPVGHASLAGLGQLAQCSLDVVGWASARWPASETMASPAWWAWGVSLLAILGSLRVGSLLARVVACLVVVSVLGRGAPAGVEPAAPRAVFFDVGQGDASLLQGRDAAVLIDGGRAVAGRFDQGERVVLPALRALGVERLDAVVATHADVDHRGGLEVILRRMRVDALWLPEGWKSDPGFDGLVEQAREAGTSIVTLAAGDPPRRYGDFALEVLWPRRGEPAGSRNDASLVLRASFVSDGRTRGRVLLAADIGEPTESALIESGALLSAEILKVGHHGSRGSSTAAWLERVGADHAIVSAPCHGRAGLPSREAIERIQATNTRIHWTGEVGAVIVGFGPHSVGLEIRHWLEARACSISHRAQ